MPTGVAGAHDEHQAKTLLDRLGITTPDRRACGDRAQARAALAELGGPVAVKILDAEVLHKTDIGGVHLGVATPTALDEALDRLDAIGATRYLVEAMAPPGVDLVLGARRDPVFGPILLLGLGGTTAEALADVAIRLRPAHAGRGRRDARTSWPGTRCSTGGAAAPSSTRRSSAGSPRGWATCSSPTRTSTRSRSTRSDSPPTA